ncbi:hypothetical protein DWX17_16395 [[Clostridium] innocuum]|nr:hypothetical protein DWX17_16395 [[Clostridium] innocuum]
MKGRQINSHRISQNLSREHKKPALIMTAYIVRQNVYDKTLGCLRKRKSAEVYLQHLSCYPVLLATISTATIKYNI